MPRNTSRSAAPQKMRKKDLPWGMPTITKPVTDHVEASIAVLPSKQRAEAVRFRDRVGIKDLTKILHATRRWYASNSGVLANKLADHRDELGTIMQLDRIPTIYRGFKLKRGDELLDRFEEGRTVTIPMPRNNGYSSWTIHRDKANMFSGATKSMVGLVVRANHGARFQAVLAPPEHTAEWFNALYREAMAGGFRDTEGEYVLFAPTMKMDVIAVKRR